MRIIGIDLSGPSNHKETVLAVFEKQGSQLQFIKLMRNMSDQKILEEVSLQSELNEVVVGIDAPLSYEDGGGDRPGDRELRKFIVGLGMKSGSVMPPTLTRMVYLTLRGIKLSTAIDALRTPYPVSIVEVHPGAVIGSRFSPKDIEYVLNYKYDLYARKFIRNWFENEQLLREIPIDIETESHSIDACAAAIGAWHWKDPLFKPKWLFSAKPPYYSYDYCC